MSSEDIKPGYKRTEVGVIPEDWVVRQLSEHFQIYAGGDVPKNSLSQIRSKTHPHPIFANALQNKGLYGFTAERRSKADSLTVTARGFLGHAEYRTEEFFPIVRLLVLEPMGGLDARFTTYAINERVSFAFESTGVPQLTAPQIRKYSVAAPSEPEQRAIATALSDVDTLLAKLDQLIAKKRDLKQATMQQLLTGQTRLPGFSGAWEVKRLGDVAILKNGYAFKSETYTELGIYKVITIANVQDGWMCLDGSNSINSLPMDLQPHQKLETGDLLLSMTGNVGRVCQVTENNCLLNQRVGKIVKQNINFDFLYAILSDVAFQKAMTDVAKGGAQPNLSAPDILKYPVNMPVDENEQKAIAEVIFDINSELTTLQARRDKTHALKQGMMQELLTGRIRLI